MRRSWRNCCPYGSRRASGRCVGPPAVGGAPGVEAMGPAGWSRRPADAWSRGGPSGRDGRVRGSCGRDGPPCGVRARRSYAPAGFGPPRCPPTHEVSRSRRTAVAAVAAVAAVELFRRVPVAAVAPPRRPPGAGSRGLVAERADGVGPSRRAPAAAVGARVAPHRPVWSGLPTAAGAVACCARPPRRGGPAGPRTRPAGRQSPRRGQAVRGPPGVAGVTGTPRAARPGAEPGGPGAGQALGWRVRHTSRSWGGPAVVPFAAAAARSRSACSSASISAKTSIGGGALARKTHVR